MKVLIVKDLSTTSNVQNSSRQLLHMTTQGFLADPFATSKSHSNANKQSIEEWL